MKFSYNMEGDLTRKKAVLAYFMGQAIAGLSRQIISTPAPGIERTEEDYHAEQDRMHDVAYDALTIAQKALELWEDEA